VPEKRKVGSSTLPLTTSCGLVLVLWPAQMPTGLFGAATVDWPRLPMRDRGRPLAIARRSHAVPSCPRIAASSSSRISWAFGRRPANTRSCPRQD